MTSLVSSAKEKNVPIDFLAGEKVSVAQNQERNPELEEYLKMSETLKGKLVAA